MRYKKFLTPVIVAIHLIKHELLLTYADLGVVWIMSHHIINYDK